MFSSVLANMNEVNVMEKSQLELYGVVKYLRFFIILYFYYSVLLFILNFLCFIMFYVFIDFFPLFSL